MQLDLSCIQKARQEYLDNSRVVEQLAVMCVEYIADGVRNGEQYVSLKHTSIVRLYNKLIRTSNSSADAVELSDSTYEKIKDTSRKLCYKWLQGMLLRRCQNISI